MFYYSSFMDLSLPQSNYFLFTSSSRQGGVTTQVMGSERCDGAVFCSAVQVSVV